ncbi:hypothetical protein FRC09_014143 [Ceratobasidium sp. 395]|nr:hypothetical protein FRC09_014143 [Ceratobasidium sp. 395]
MTPPIRKKDIKDDDQGLQNRTEINGGAAGFKPRIPAIGAELDRDAQVWEVYVDETDRSDKELVKSWNELMIESSKRLQPDPTETSVQTLQAMSHVLIAISNGQPVDNSTSSGASPSRFSPSRSSVLVNALWFLTLTLSVTVSLVAMVSKSWCNAFMSNRTGPKYEQGRRRQRKWNAIEAWGMENVFVYLPTLMHIALCLCVYLWDICLTVAIPVLFVTVVFVSLYVIVTILPSAYQDCPYSTPLSKPLERLLSSAYLTTFLRRLRRAARILPQARQGSRDPARSPVHQTTLRSESTPMDKVTSQMLLWIICNCEDSQLVDTALHSIAGARPGSSIETLAEAHVTELLVQRLNNSLLINPSTNTIRLRPSSSVEVVSLYGQALSRLLEYEAGFVSSSDYYIPQLNREQLGKFFGNRLDPTILNLYILSKRCFTSAGSSQAHIPGEDHSQVAITVASILTPLYHGIRFWGPASYSLTNDRVLWVQRKNNQLIQNHVDKAVAIDSRTLLALLEAAPHWILGRMMDMYCEERIYSIILLVQLIHSPSCSAPELQYAIGLSLTVAAVLMHDYPGWEHPQDNIEDRTTRAIEVYRYYKAEHYEEPKVLIVFGLLGLLQSISDARAFYKHDITILTDALAQMGECSSLHYRIRTLPKKFTLKQHVKSILMEVLQVVINRRPDFGEVALVSCLMQLVFTVTEELHDSSVIKLARQAFCPSQNNKFQAVCLKLLYRSHLSPASWEDLEPIQMSRLIDISLGDDVYVAPAAMSFLWKITSWLIKEANTASSGRLTRVLTDILQHDAFALLRVKATELSDSPPSVFEVGFADMWYPLLKEMKSHKWAASVVDESGILPYMRASDRAGSTVPYLEELQDGRSWYDILKELDYMCGCGVVV